MQHEDTIQTNLSSIEKRHGVRMLLAVEYGSRAQGTATPVSDHDVRAIYTHSIERYAGLREPLESTRSKPNPSIDIQAHDVRWFMSNLIRNNPIAIAALGSAPVFRVDEDFASDCRTLVDKVFDPREAAYHLTSLARRSLSETNSRLDRSPLKNLLHVRRLLAVRDEVERSGRFPFRIEESTYIEGLEALVANRKLTCAQRSDLALPAIASLEKALATRKRPMIDREESYRMAEDIIVRVATGFSRELAGEAAPQMAC